MVDVSAAVVVIDEVSVVVDVSGVVVGILEVCVVVRMFLLSLVVGVQQQ